MLGITLLAYKFTFCMNATIFFLKISCDRVADPATCLRIDPPSPATAHSTEEYDHLAPWGPAAAVDVAMLILRRRDCRWSRLQLCFAAAKLQLSASSWVVSAKISGARAAPLGCEDYSEPDSQNFEDWLVVVMQQHRRNWMLMNLHLQCRDLCYYLRHLHRRTTPALPLPAPAAPDHRRSPVGGNRGSYYPCRIGFGEAGVEEEDQRPELVASFVALAFSLETTLETENGDQEMENHGWS